jgi:hypothetical protein
MSIKHFFLARKVEMSDNSELYELVTPLGERIASASTQEAMDDLEMALNMELTSAAEANDDIEVEA